MIASLAIYLAIMSIGVVVSHLILPDLDKKEKLLIGSCLGLALGIYTGVITAYLRQLNTSGLRAALFICASILAWLAIRQRRIKTKVVSAESGRTFTDETLGLVTVLAISSAIRVAFQYFSELPIGWDPAFHCIITKIIVMNGGVPTSWAPFEQVPLNYAWGSHMLLALASLAGGDEIHHAFRVLLLVSTCCSVYGVYIVSLRVFQSEKIALWSGFAYGLLSHHGSLDYNNWGGLPNALGMLFLLGLTTIFLNQKTSRAKKILLGGFILSGIILSHGHAMLVTLMIFASYAVLQATASRTLNNDELRDIVMILALGFGFCAFYTLPLTEKILSFGQTQVIWSETYISFLDFPHMFGELLLPFLIIGFACSLSRMTRERVFVLIWVITLLYGYLFAEYGIRFYYLFKFNLSTSGFTPSRFPTDMAYPLSVIAGVGLDQVYKRLASVDHSFLRDSRLFRSNFRALLIVGLLLYPYMILGQQWGRRGPSLQVIEACGWIQNNTPQNSLIINDCPDQEWVPYLTGREVSFTPLPVSEFIDDPSIAWKHHLANAVLASPESAPQIFSSDRPVYIMVSTSRDWSDAQTVHLARVFKNRRVVVYEVIHR